MSVDIRRVRLVPAALGVALLLAMGIELARAEDPDLETKILHALKPKSLTRGLMRADSPKVEPPEQQHLIEALPTSRPLSVKEREDIAAAAKDKPSIDLEIYFDFRSAEVGEKAIPTVTALGHALASPDLKGGVFLVAGHTDAKGSASYNQQLSERRAGAVKRVLVDKFGLAAKNLVTVGYGKEQLKNKDDPLGGENRRVQIINLEARKDTAGQ